MGASKGNWAHRVRSARPDGRQSDAIAPPYSMWCSTSVSHTVRIVYHGGRVPSRGYTLRIVPRGIGAGGGNSGGSASEFSRGSGGAGPLKSVSIILHTYADTESYPQLPHSFQQPGGSVFKAFAEYGRNLQTRNRTSFLCESGGLFDIISI